MRSAGTPWPVTRKKPVSRQAASIRHAISRFSASLPVRSGDMPMVGIVGLAAIAHLPPCTGSLGWRLYRPRYGPQRH
jgi:hypothetical protein